MIIPEAPRTWKTSQSLPDETFWVQGLKGKKSVHPLKKVVYQIATSSFGCGSSFHMDVLCGVGHHSTKFSTSTCLASPCSFDGRYGRSSISCLHSGRSPVYPRSNDMSRRRPQQLA